MALLKVLNLLLNILWSSAVLNDLVFNLLVFVEQLAELASPLCHYIEQRLGDHALVADSSVPYDGPDSLWYAFSPKFAAFRS